MSKMTAKAGGFMQKNNYNRWLVVAGGIICQFVIGALYTWSVFQKPIEAMFGWSASEVSLAFTINLAFIPILMIISGGFLSKYGPTKMAITGASVLSLGLLLAANTRSLWMLYLGYGVLGGAGIGIAYGVPIATCVKWFPDKRGMISGLAVMGFGMGSVAFAPIATALVSLIGPLRTFFFQAIYTIVGVSIGAQLMKAAPECYCPPGYIAPITKVGQTGPSRYDFTPKEMLKTKQYWVILIMYAFANIAGLMIIGHASPIGQQVAKLTPIQAASIVSIMSIFNSLGRLFWGAFSDKIGRLKVVIIMYLISAIAMFSLNSLNNYWIYALGVSVVAFCFGGAMGTFPSITADFYGPKYMSVNYGLVFLAYSIGAIVGPRLAAVVVQSTGSYNMAFIISGIFCAIGSFVALVLKAPKAPVSQKSQSN